MSVSFRIRPVTTRIDAALAARAARLPAANIGDVMNRMQTMRGGFRTYGGRRAVAGPTSPYAPRPATTSCCTAP